MTCCSYLKARYARQRWRHSFKIPRVIASFLLKKPSAQRQAGPWRGGQSRPAPGYGVTVVPLRYVPVQTVMKLLDTFAVKPGAIRADTTRNLLHDPG